MFFALDNKLHQMSYSKPDTRNDDELFRGPPLTCLQWLKCHTLFICVPSTPIRESALRVNIINHHYTITCVKMSYSLSRSKHRTGLSRAMPGFWCPNSFAAFSFFVVRPKHHRWLLRDRTRNTPRPSNNRYKKGYVAYILIFLTLSHDALYRKMCTSNSFLSAAHYISVSYTPSTYIFIHHMLGEYIHYANHAWN